MVVVVLSGLVVLIVLPFVRSRRVLLELTLAFAAAALFAALILVALDRFTYEEQITPIGFFSSDGPTRVETHQLWLLLGFWAVPLALLVSHGCHLHGSRGWPATAAVLALAATAIGAVAATAHPQVAVAGSTGAASKGPPDGILICRNPLYGP